MPPSRPLSHPALLGALLALTVAGLAHSAQRTWWVEPEAPESAHFLNGQFDSDVSGWVITDPTNVPMTWDTMDALGAPGSGSALITSSAVPSNNGGVFQCIFPVVPGAVYTLHARIRVASGQPALAGSAGIFLLPWTSSTCTGSGLGSTASAYISTNAPPASLDVWVPVTATLTMPAEAQSMWVYLNMQRHSAPTGFAARFDAITLDMPLHADGFESGDFSTWDEVRISVTE